MPQHNLHTCNVIRALYRWIWCFRAYPLLTDDDHATRISAGPSGHEADILRSNCSCVPERLSLGYLASANSTTFMHVTQSDIDLKRKTKINIRLRFVSLNCYGLFGTEQSGDGSRGFPLLLFFSTVYLATLPLLAFAPPVPCLLFILPLHLFSSRNEGTWRDCFQSGLTSSMILSLVDARQ